MPIPKKSRSPAKPRKSSEKPKTLARPRRGKGKGKALPTISLTEPQAQSIDQIAKVMERIEDTKTREDGRRLTRWLKTAGRAGIKTSSVISAVLLVVWQVYLAGRVGYAFLPSHVKILVDARLEGMVYHWLPEGMKRYFGITSMLHKNSISPPLSLHPREIIGSIAKAHVQLEARTANSALVENIVDRGLVRPITGTLTVGIAAIDGVARAIPSLLGGKGSYASFLKRIAGMTPQELAHQVDVRDILKYSMLRKMTEAEKESALAIFTAKLAQTTDKYAMHFLSFGVGVFTGGRSA